MDFSQNENLRDKDFRLANILRRIGDAKGRARAINKSENAPQERAVQKPASVAVPAQSDAELGAADKWPLPGLAPMTRVRTNFGDVHAIALREGDMVQTRDGEYRKIVWLNRVLLDAGFVASKPESNPIEIRAGAVAKGVPAADLMVSPRQIVAPAGTSGPGASLEAADLMSRPGISRKRETGLSYTMFHVGEAADVMCEGAFLRFAPQR